MAQFAKIWMKKRLFYTKFGHRAGCNWKIDKKTVRAREVVSLIFCSVGVPEEQFLRYLDAENFYKCQGQNNTPFLHA